MPQLAGLIAATSLLLGAFKLLPIDAAWYWQATACLALAAVNMVVWHQAKPAPMSIREAATTAFLGFAVISVVTALDMAIGFLFGAKSIPQAFIHSGAFGGIADAFLFSCALLVGIPTLVKAVYEFHLLGR